MSLTAKLITSLLIATVAATLTSVMLTGAAFEPVLLIAFAIVAVSCALLGGRTRREARGGDASADRGESTHSENALDPGRDLGRVKWFNVSKGFGFIVKDDGEEIFVHFRSIRGTGRRGLRDGQRVSFVVADSDKGPQAEDVVAEED